jgi:hypothetical protein
MADFSGDFCHFAALGAVGAPPWGDASPQAGVAPKRRCFVTVQTWGYGRGGLDQHQRPQRSSQTAHAPGRQYFANLRAKY